MNRKNCLIVFFITVVFVIAQSVQMAAAENWGSLVPLSDGVEISYAQVNGDTWTWRFHNDNAATITTMEFTYEDKDGMHNDSFPGELKGFQTFGGWAAFTASSRPTIRITKIERGGKKGKFNLNPY